MQLLDLVSAEHCTALYSDAWYCNVAEYRNNVCCCIGILHYVGPIGYLFEIIVFTDFDEDFIENLVDNLPFFDFMNASNRGIENVLENLVDNYEIEDDDRFDVGDFVENLLGSSVNTIASTINASSTIQCVQRVFNSLFNTNAIEDMTLRIQEIRRAITALRRIQEFLDQQEDMLEDADIPQSCVDLFIENAFCNRCTQLTPPLCFATCNAIVRGCYSPYYTVLNNQYQRLWEQVRNIANIANITVQNIIQGEGQLIDVEELVSKIFL